MFAALFIAVDTQGKAVVYNEIYKPNLIVSEAAQLLKSQMRKLDYKSIIAPPDLWGRNRDTGKSTAEIFRQNGLVLSKASNNRVDGWMSVKEWLRVCKGRHEQTGENIEMTNVVIFKTCANLIRCLPQMQHDDKNPNDCANEPHEITHICDAFRYFCISRTSPSNGLTVEQRFFDAFKPYEQTFCDYGEDVCVV